MATYGATSSSMVASKSIFIPENNSRTFLSSVLLVSARLSTTATTLTGLCRIGCGIDSIATSSLVTAPFGNGTAEHVTYLYHVPFTDYFNTNFTSSAHTVKTYFSATNESVTGLTYKLILTYQFDDTNTNTSIKTVRLPINSITGSTLPATNVYLGNYTGSIPAFDSYLPEQSKTYRDIFIEYHGNDAGAGTTAFAMRETIDNGSPSTRMLVSQSLSSTAYYYDLHNLSGSISTATTHSIRVNSTVASRFTGVYGICYVTYEYDYTGSTRILNSCILPIKDSIPYTPVRNIYIPS